MEEDFQKWWLGQGRKLPKPRSHLLAIGKKLRQDEADVDVRRQMYNQEVERFDLYELGLEAWRASRRS